MAEKAKFQTGDRVKCYHGPIMYTAKLMKYEVRDKEHYYFVHYEGWNKNWDEWVPENRIHVNTDVDCKRRPKAAGIEMIETPSKEVAAVRKRKKDIDSDYSNPSTPTGIDTNSSTKTDPTSQGNNTHSRKRTISKAFAADKKSTIAARRELRLVKKEKLSESALSDTVTPAKTSTESKKNKTKYSKTKSTGEKSKSTKEVSSSRQPSCDKETVETEKCFMNKMCVQFRLEDTLKNCMINDHDLINRQKMLLTVPAKKSIQSIMEDYVKNFEAPLERDRIAMFCEGICEYFNTSLGKVLLYKFERNQYSQIIKKHSETLILRKDQITPINDIDSKLKEKQYVRVYGAIHLIRLFTKLGDMMAYSDICKPTLKYIIKMVDDFSKYISKYPEYLSMDNYHIASPEYLRTSLDII